MAWDVGRLSATSGEDLRVPPEELLARQERLRSSLSDSNLKSAWISDPVDLYWLCGNRQSGGAWFPAETLADSEPVQFVRSSLSRARHEAGGDDAPHLVEAMPRMSTLADELRARGARLPPALQMGRLPASDASFIASKLAPLTTPSNVDVGDSGGDCTRLLWELREVKSEWEIERIQESGEVQLEMFEAVGELGSTRSKASEAFTELDLAAAAEKVSREAGFGGHIRMRKWPMDCDRAVVAAGPSGVVPSFFDSAVGGVGANPLAALGAGNRRIEAGEPVIVDIVHVHRGYVSDMTRMFSLGAPNTEWLSRQSDMIEVAGIIRESLGRGDHCSAAWQAGFDAATERGHAEHLMGMAPDQARFLGHSIGLELDETPVVAAGFDRPLPVGGTMAIEPKVIHPGGAVGIEDSWVRTTSGMERLSGGSGFPYWTEW